MSNSEVAAVILDIQKQLDRGEIDEDKATHLIFNALLENKEIGLTSLFEIDEMIMGKLKEESDDR